MRRQPPGPRADVSEHSHRLQQGHLPSKPNSEPLLRFAKQANARNFEAAQALLEEGLEKYPNDKTLKKDMADLLKVKN